jgi:hypothetical protein
MKRVFLTPILIPDKPLTRRSLLVARLLSAGVMLASLVLFLIALPVRFDWLSRFSAGAERVLLERTLLLNDVIHSVTDVFPYVAMAIELGVMLLFFLIAAFLYRLRSHEWLVLLTAAGLVSFALHITPTLKTWMDAEPDLAVIGILFKAIGLGLSFLFLYLFPSGFYAPRWIRLFALLWVVWAVLWLLYPDSVLSFEDPYTIDLIGFVLLMAWWGTGIFAQLYRYWRVSGPVERQQTKYVTFGATIVAIAYCLYVPLRQLMLVLPRPDLADIIFHMIAPYVYLVLVAAIPITITLSILRYRLWDIDLIIRRTMVYTALTLTLAVLYFGSVVLMQVLFVAISGRSTGSPSLVTLRSPLAVVISTLGIAALFTPLRKRIQNDIDRRFFRNKYDTDKTLEAFSASLREETDLDELSEGLLKVVTETLQPESVSLWMQKPPSDDKKA